MLLNSIFTFLTKQCFCKYKNLSKAIALSALFKIFFSKCKKIKFFFLECSQKCKRHCMAFFNTQRQANCIVQQPQKLYANNLNSNQQPRNAHATVFPSTQQPKQEYNFPPPPPQSCYLPPIIEQWDFVHSQPPMAPQRVLTFRENPSEFGPYFVSTPFGKKRSYDQPDQQTYGSHAASNAVRRQTLLSSEPPKPSTLSRPPPSKPSSSSTTGQRLKTNPRSKIQFLY